MYYANVLRSAKRSENASHSDRTYLHEDQNSISVPPSPGNLLSLLASAIHSQPSGSALALPDRPRYRTTVQGRGPNPMLACENPEPPGIQITCSPVRIFDHKMLLKLFPTTLGVARICQTSEIEVCCIPVAETPKPFISHATTVPSELFSQRMPWRPFPLKSPKPAMVQFKGTTPKLI